MLDTPANRAIVNRGIAEAIYGDVIKDCCVRDDGSIDILINGWIRKDYTRDLNACYAVCEERGWHINVLWVSGVLRYEVFIAEVDNTFQKGTDLRWLVAVAVWEAVNRGE